VRLVLLGSPPFATPVLERVLGSRHRVLAVVTRPDKPSGRGLRTEASSLVGLARSREIRALQPASAAEPSFAAELVSLAPEVLLVASYGEILKARLLELAPYGALNVHASLLPRHRGASPIQAAILAGDRETGVSVQRMVLALDEGDVLLEMRTEIGGSETAGELLGRLAVLGGEAAVRALDALESGTAAYTPQDPARVTYAKRIRKEQGRIDWTRSAAEIERHVRAMTPWPGARTSVADGAEVVILEARASARPAAEPRPPGSLVVVNETPFVATGEGLVEIRSIKPSGKGAMDAKAWLRGARLPPGVRFAS
jgi:methionyl-tRNA formyltransferase